MADKRWQRAICQEVISNGEEAVANLGDDKEVFIIIAINPLTHLIARVEYNVSTVVTVISPGYSTDYRLPPKSQFKTTCGDPKNACKLHMEPDAPSGWPVD